MVAAAGDRCRKKEALKEDACVAFQLRDESIEMTSNNKIVIL